MADEKLKADIEIGDPKAAIDDFKAKLAAGLNDVKIGGGFTKEIQAGLDGAEKKALSLQGSLKSLAAVDPKGKGLDWISKQAQSSQKEIAGINAKLQTIQKLASQTSSKSLLKIYEDDAKALGTELDRAEKKMLRLQQARLNKGTAGGSGSGSGSGVGEAVAGEFGLPLSTAAGAAIVAGVTIKTAKDVFDAARASQDSIRILSASAKQAGLDFDLVNEKTEKFADLTAQSKTAAADTYASIVQFSKQAGQTENIDKFTKAFADLTAAKGIDKKSLPDLLSQLKTGQDEVFDRLAGANPSKFYNEFAQAIGTTADKLTDTQKAQARFDAILKLGIMFNGEAEKKLDSLSGKADTLGAKFENLYTRAGKAATPFIKSLLDQANDFLDFTQSKGLFASDEEKSRIRAEAQKNADEQVKIFVDEQRGIQKKIDDAAKKPLASLESFALSKIDSTKYFLEQSAKEIEEIRPDGSKLKRLENVGEITARLQQIRDAATKEAQAEIDAKKELYEKTLADKNTSLSTLQLLRSDFDKNQNLFTPDQKEKFRREIADAVSGSIAKGFQSGLSDPNINAAGLIKKLKELQAGVSGLLPETTKALINDYEKAIKAMSEKTVALRDSIRDELTNAAGRDNPLVKLMVDFESATDRAEKRFGQFGAGVVKTMADLDRQNISDQINKILYDGSKKALQYEQEARRLQRTPASGLDQFQQRLGGVGSAADNAQNQADLQRKLDEALYYAKTFNPNNPKSFDQFRLGNNTSAFSGQAKDILDQVQALQRVDLNGTGDAGKGLIAEKIDKLINVPVDELLKALDRGGADAFNAQKLLDLKAGTAKDLLSANNAKFADELAQQQFAQQGRADALELIKNLGSAKGLTDPQKIQEFLSITGELGTENLTPELRKARIQALGTAADQTRAEAKVAADRAKDISDAMTEINRQLKAGGLLVKNSTTPIVEIDVKDGSLSATQRGLGTRANNSSVNQLTQ